MAHPSDRAECAIHRLVLLREMTYQTSSISANISGGGVLVYLVPNDGGNGSGGSIDLAMFRAHAAVESA